MNPLRDKGKLSRSREIGPPDNTNRNSTFNITLVLNFAIGDLSLVKKPDALILFTGLKQSKPEAFYVLYGVPKEM